MAAVVLGPQHIDFEKELIKLSSTEATEVKELPGRISKECARYHFFLYKHSHEGDYLESTGESTGCSGAGTTEQGSKVAGSIPLAAVRGLNMLTQFGLEAGSHIPKEVFWIARNSIG